MTHNKNDLYVSWLNDAHAMEQGLITMLEKQVEEIKGEAVMQNQIKKHLEETKRHADLMKDAVERNGGDTSAIKDTVSKVGSTLSGYQMSMASDAVVKNVLSSYAAENMEIASYQAIKIAADELGDAKTSSACEEIIEDEKRMALWLLEEIPAVVRKFIPGKA